MLGPNKSYLSLKDSAHVPESLIKDSPLRPSNAGVCERELFIKYQAWKDQTKVEDVGPRVHRIFKLGHAIEALIIKDFKVLPSFKVLYEQQLMDHGIIPGTSQLFQGSMDWCLISEEHKCVMDAKSRGGRGSYTWEQDLSEAGLFGAVIDEVGVWIDDTDKFVAESKDHELVKNILQLNVYATSKFCVDRGITHGSIIRYNKLDCREVEIRFKPSQVLLRYVLGKFERVAAAKSINDTNQECQPGSMKQRFCLGCKGREFTKVGYGTGLINPPAPLGELPAQLLEQVEQQKNLLSKNIGKDLQQWMLLNNKMKVMLDANTVLTLELLKSPNPHYEFRIKPLKKGTK